MRNVLKYVLLLIVGALIISLGQRASAQSSDSQQAIPDAPSATRPFPKPEVSPTAPIPGPADQNGTSAPEQVPDQSPTQSGGQPTQPAPPPQITTVPQGGASNEPTSGRDQMFKLAVNVNFVNVPVTVKDSDGHLVAGLRPSDFEVLENGQKQRLTFFTSDPFPLSAAVVLDQGMSDVEFSKVKETLPALVAAFGQFDEVAIYTYGNTVSRVQGFVPAQNDSFLDTIRKIQRNKNGESGGVPVAGGPMASGPTYNGRPVNPGAAQTVDQAQRPTYYEPNARVLNDAILQAAMELGQRDRTRRKILFVISNGRELRSDATYDEVKKLLLTYQITVYAVGVSEAGLPGWRQLNRIRIPGQGFGDILPKYAAATGGQVFPEFSRDAIIAAYNQIAQEARNQYTLGYITRATPSSTYRSIEVRVAKPDLKVIARDGYYPLPPPPTPR